MPDSQRPGQLRDLQVNNHPSSLRHMSPPSSERIADQQKLHGCSVQDDYDFGGHVLLTPPPQPDYVNPLDKLAMASSPINIGGNNQNGKSEEAQHWSHSSRRENTASSTTSSRDAATLLNGLHIRTDVGAVRRQGSDQSMGSEYLLRTSASQASLPRRAPSIRAALHSTAGSLSPGSVIGSPQIAAMLDITPLPSPTMSAFESWKHVARTRSRGSSISSRSDLPPSVFPPLSSSPSSPRRKGYPSLHTSRQSIDEDDRDDHARNRSISEYVPEAIAFPKTKNISVSGSGPPIEVSSPKTALHREEYLGETRGLVTPTVPHHPPSIRHDATHDEEPSPKRQKREVFVASSVYSDQPRSYEAIQELGTGTFSKVWLAVRKMPERRDTIDYTADSVNLAGVKARSRRLVAVKVVEHGPAGGADAERVETSLKREVELLKAVKHPSLVHLKAFGTDGTLRALLVMNYCPGGDLFEVASTKLEVLTPPLVRRIFAELVSAVRYLHQKYIVHRDIKLENVLLNIPLHVHKDVPDWQTLDRAVITLTDLGLSRRIPEPPESPLLTTRCGSEDYAAPEILMGQPYDGRQTDAWALGVLLYSLMEGRLPFDPVPGARGDPAILRARTPHRIARIEWSWVRYGDEDGDWDAEKGKDLQGAFSVLIAC
ncbi:Serine/threonine-protein kinase PRR1 [Cyphellophora attinorum]|uniref:Serine/threonine-protein kinase PRR1 n=1 Tax=Cyphellophora attinorum TaxID=1664694 RepID=A0A0N1H5U0_9EURO|nr:Serine/threonine-protein kinase PRR1 [Phialophora attinorum]KPI36490.1 Serine/threonine-protein kinase PRR1 [Phialophora attinorum]